MRKGVLLVAELGAPPAGRLVDVENAAFSVDCLPSWPRRLSSSLVRVIVEAMIVGVVESSRSVSLLERF